MKLGMWVVMGTSTTHVVCRHWMCIFNASFAYLFWLANNKKSNIQSSVWATLMKLSMWVVMGTSTTHVVCHHQMRIFNTSFAYLFWLAYNQKINIQSSEWATLMKPGMWVVMGISTKYYPHVSVVTKCAYLIPHLHICSDWLITKIKYPDFCMGYIDETWYVGSDGHKYYPCGLSSPNAHI